MSKVFNYIIRYEGLNFTNFMNFLIKNNIEIYDVKMINIKNIEFKISRFNYKKLRKINTVFKLILVKDFSIKMLLKNTFKRFGLVCGCVIIFVLNLLAYYSSEIIKVVGDTLYANEIIDAVNEYNKANENTKFNNVEIEKYLVENIDNISLVSVKKQGNIILISVIDKKESAVNYEPLYAPYNMIINDIELISGTLLVSKNDVIKKGDIIIDSYSISSTGERILVPAKANITADVWFCGSEVIMKENIIYNKTGNKKEYFNVCFNKVEYIDKMSPYKDYVSETKIINVANKYFLPIYLIKNTYYETQKIIEKFNYEKEKNNCLEKSKQKAYTNLPKNVTIQEMKQSVSELSDRYIFQTYLKTTMEINNED